MQNKLYTTVAETYNELKNFKGEFDSLDEKVEHVVNNGQKEVEEARGNFSNLNGRFIDIEDNIKLNKINYDNIEDKIEEVKNDFNSKIPSIDDAIIRDENTAIGVKLHSIKDTYSQKITLSSKEKHIMRIEGSKFNVKTYVKAYNEFLQDFVGDSNTNTISVNLSGGIYPNTVEISNSYARLKKSGVKKIDFGGAYLLDSDKLTCEVPNVLTAKVNKVYNNSILDLFCNDFIIPTSRNTCEVTIEFNEAIYLDNVFSTIEWNDNIGIVELTFTYNDGTSYYYQYSGNIFSLANPNKDLGVTSIFIKYYIATPNSVNGFTVTSLELVRDVVCNTGYITENTVSDIESMYMQTMTINTNGYTMPQNTDIKVALCDVNDWENGYVYIPDSIDIDKSNCTYLDGNPCTETKIMPLCDYYMPKERIININTRDEHVSNLLTLGNSKITNYDEVFDGAIKYKDCVAKLYITINDKKYELLIYNFGNNVLSTEYGIINVEVFRVNNSTIGINITSQDVTDLDNFTVNFYSKYNIENDKELWNINKSSYEYNEYEIPFINFNNKYNYINFKYNVSHYDLSNKNVNITNSINNGECGMSYAIFPTKNNYYDKDTLIVEDSLYRHSVKYNVTKLPITMFVTAGKVDDVTISDVRSRIVKYYGIYDNLVKSDRNTLIAKLFISDKSILTKLVPTGYSGTIKYKVSFDGNIFYGYDFANLKWDKNISNTVSELQNINDVKFDLIRCKSEYLYLLIEFENTNSYLNKINVQLESPVMAKIKTEDTLIKGMSVSTLPKVDFNKVLDVMKSFRIYTSLKSVTNNNSPTIKGYVVKNSNDVDWIPIEYTDVREYISENGNVTYINKSDETRYLKAIITDTKSNIASDMNKQSYIEEISEIKKSHKELNYKIDALMQNVSNLMNTLHGPSGNEYINNFLINNYREFESGVIDFENSFVIDGINNVASVEVWSVISSKLTYSVNLSISSKNLREYKTNGYIDFIQTGAVIKKVGDKGNVYFDSEVALSETNKKLVTKDYTLTCNVVMTKTPKQLLAGTEINGTGSWYCWYWYKGYQATYSLSDKEKYVDYIFDFGFNKYVDSVYSMSAGGLNHSQAKDIVEDICKQRTSIAYSYDNKEYVELHSFTGCNHTGSHSDKGRSYSVGKNIRYLRIRLEKTVHGPAMVAIKHFGIKLADDDYKYDTDCIIQFKQPIDTSLWKSIESMLYDVVVNQSINDIRFVISSNGTEWYGFKKTNTYLTSTITYGNAMTLDEVKALNSYILNRFVGGKLYVAAVLRTSDRYTTPILRGISFKYTTSDSVNNYLKLDQHDYTCVYSEDDKRITITNTSGGQKKFKVLVS